MNYNTAKQDSIEMVLRQMGAEIHSIHGMLCHVSFKVGDLDISYVYNINRWNKFYLQRLHPYPIGSGTFESEDEALMHIKNDMDILLNAFNSSKFTRFTALAHTAYHTTHDLEALFMNHNVSEESLARLDQLLTQLKDEIGSIQQQSPVIKINPQE